MMTATEGNDQVDERNLIVTAFDKNGLVVDDNCRST